MNISLPSSNDSDFFTPTGASRNWQVVTIVLVSQRY
jgi:hypothetical protein